jgi:glutathione S-transferase
MPARLYVVEGSPPCAAVRRALQLKGTGHEVVALVPPLHAAAQWLRFGVRTVPAIVLASGEKLSGSRAIVRRLEELAPTPALLPREPRALAAVQRAEEWGDEVFQPIARRLLWQSLALCPAAIASYADGLRLPAVAMRVLAPLVTATERRLNDADDLSVRADLRALPRHLERVDRWLATGTLGGEQVNAADLQIAAVSRLLLTLGDLRPFFAGRPAEAHARALFADWAGATPPGVFPGAWLAEPHAAV